MEVPKKPIKIEEKKEKPKVTGSSITRQASRRKHAVELKYTMKKLKILNNIMRAD